MESLVSIITPTYNSEAFIEQTIESVINQIHQNWELIIVDDGSTDQTTEIVSVSAKKDNRIVLISLKENSGPAKARNEGITHALGKYMTFLDADDIWFPKFISTSIETIVTNQVFFVFASYKRCNENLEFVYSDFVVPEKAGYTDILKTNSISCLTAFIDIEILGKKKMPDILKRQDMGLWLQYLKDIPFAYGIKQPLAIYRIRKNSLSRNKSKLLKYQWRFYREVEHLSILRSVYYMIYWMYNGFVKYRN